MEVKSKEMLLEDLAEAKKDGVSVQKEIIFVENRTTKGSKEQTDDQADKIKVSASHMRAPLSLQDNAKHIKRDKSRL